MLLFILFFLSLRLINRLTGKVNVIVHSVFSLIKVDQ